MKYSFRNDYSELAHPEVLGALMKASKEQNAGYGLDLHTENAKKSIRKTFGCPKSDIHFITGGTQTNMLFISYALKPYEAALACHTGHINVHETGAVEATGHKIVSVEGSNGKLYPKDIEEALATHSDCHMVKIKLVYISNSTELGTIYTLEELKALYKCCQKNNLYLFLDGARLASALTSPLNDIKPTDLSKYTDAFYIGGTKNGLLSGEALVINTNELKEDFRYHIKNKGAMLAKGFVLGIQFKALFEEGLYFEIGKHENELALYLTHEMKKLAIPFLYESPTNQIFIILEDSIINKLKNLYDFEVWQKVDETHQAIRIVVSFSTKKEVCEEFANDLKKILEK